MTARRRPRISGDFHEKKGQGAVRMGFPRAILGAGSGTAGWGCAAAVVDAAAVVGGEEDRRCADRHRRAANQTYPRATTATCVASDYRSMSVGAPLLDPHWATVGPPGEFLSVKFPAVP